MLALALAAAGPAPRTVAAGPAEFSLTPAAAYATQVPTPAAVLGHELGEEFSTHEQVRRVVEAIALASDRVEVRRYGTTWAGRPLVLALVSSPANLARIEAIGDGLRALEDPRPDPDGAARAAVIERSPAVCWLSFSVHGNEASGTEASLATLYHLAAAEDDEVARMLDDVVVVVDPCLNPDGRERYVQWYRSVRGPTPDPDPQALVHDEPWPRGRSNHYHFDLNRDWAFLTQVERRARLRAWRRLPPQVHADLHELGSESSYFFFPAAPPFNQNLPADTLRWGEVFGAANAAAFDRFGWTYFTGEAFDLLYPGYGDSWPSLNAAIGMTYEQAGHGRAGLVVRRSDGTLLTLADRVAHHFTAAVETVRTTATHRRALLERFARWHDDAVWEGREGPIAAYLLERTGSGHAVDELVRLLLAQGIEVHEAAEPFEVAEGHPFDGGPPAARRFAPGTVVVPLAQPRKRLAKALLEPRAAVRENQFYDVSAWSLPLAFGVHHAS
ncbi:MAG: M14 family zinc carboxypeptidase, partial [Planctomycetota bacterium JB042]